MFRRILITTMLFFALALTIGCDSSKKGEKAEAETPAATDGDNAARGEEAKGDEKAEEGAAAAPEAADDTEAAKKDEGGTNNAPEQGDQAMNPALLDPTKATESAPDTFKVKFETTKGDFVVQVNKAWAPNGADRFYNLVKIGYYDNIAFFRVINGFMAQFGISGNPEVNKVWREARIQDDQVKESNTRGRITFATAGPNTRTTQLFINFGNNAMLDAQGFSPFGEVVEGMDIVDAINDEYGEGAPRGRGPNQMLVQQQGNEYLKQGFPNLDYVKKATVIE